MKFLNIHNRVYFIEVHFILISNNEGTAQYGTLISIMFIIIVGFLSVFFGNFILLH